MNITLIAFIQNLNPTEIIVIACVVLLFFGAKRLPGLVRSLGTSVREFKQAASGVKDDIRTAMDVDVEPTETSQKTVPSKPEIA